MYFDYYNMYNQYYNLNNENFRGNKQTNDGEIITLSKAIELIKKSIGDEKEDELFYDNLIAKAPSEKEKNIIRSIRNDERKHNQILRKLYYEFTGKTVSEDNFMPKLNENMDYKKGLEKALFGELDATKKYRKIMGAMPSGTCYTLLMSIMTDEIIHASKYNFLIQNI